MLRLSPRVLALVVAWSGVGLAGCGEGKGEPPGEPRREFVEVVDEGQTTLRADLDLTIGEVTLGHAEDGTLFQAEIDLPADGFAPAFSSTNETTESGPQARVTLGLASEPAGLRDLGGDLDWRLYFSPERPLDLDLHLGAASADLELAGIPLRRLTLQTGVAATDLSFDEPNLEPLRRMDVFAGVGEVELDELGNARFERLEFKGGVGRYTLDFTGEAIVPGAEARVEVGIATLEIALPEDVPIVLDAPSSRVSAVEVPAGLVTLGGGRYATPGAEDDLDAFTLIVRTGPGRTRITMED
ncbi:MAG: hypothetical protein AAF170_11670 [Bacteroidota bacterium]